MSTKPTDSPIYSMTGFARSSGRATETLGFTVSLKSVNHRFLDLHLRLPSGSEALEMQMRRMLKEKLGRGHVEVTLNVDRSQKSEAGYDTTLVAAYLDVFHVIRREHNLHGEPDLNAILSLPGIFKNEGRGSERNAEEEVQVLEASVMQELPALIDALNSMRSQEGAVLAAELHAGLDRLRLLVDEAAGLRENVQQAYFERITQRLNGLIGNAMESSLDRDRILQEAAMLAERSDVEEEVTRLRTHIDHFRTLLDGGGEVGKKLDFLLQEMNREANTLLSKTGGVAGNGPRITELGLGMKSEIEKAREQIQNLE